MDASVWQFRGQGTVRRRTHLADWCSGCDRSGIVCRPGRGLETRAGGKGGRGLPILERRRTMFNRNAMGLQSLLLLTDCCMLSEFVWCTSPALTTCSSKEIYAAVRQFMGERDSGPWMAGGLP